MKVSVMWRGNKYTIEIDSKANLKDFCYELRNLTGITAETLRLIAPRLNEKGSNLILPFSDDHSCLTLHESSIVEGKTIIMMGVTEEEVNGVQKDAIPDMRILGFEDEERRLRQKKFSITSIKLPQGPYIFCAFRTLQLPLSPPPADALKRMHMLASDPGIIAIMNKHHWRVGIMTELAPVGYVGVSPKCLLGFNKNQGEEISLRLRTDDLKGFRKYQSIKRHYSMSCQLNKEAESLDWTKSRGHTLNGAKGTKDFDDEEDFFDEIRDENFAQRVGGNQYHLGNARESSVAAAYRRLSHTSDVGASKLREEPDPDDSVVVRDENKQPILPEAHSDSRSEFEPDPDDAIEDVSAPEHHLGSLEIGSDVAHPAEPYPDDSETRTSIPEVENMELSNDTVMSDGNFYKPTGETNVDETIIEVDEPDPDDIEIQRIQDSVTIVSNRLKKAIYA
ncbi:hypothetical protein Bca52824_026964 [Brassica carinata]|uniref:WLM domain-containing protein n=1 Tax=Brassica carinata TaxID=52824 RepID=A0A8X7VA40_BRACI|nr:hypothetical protein Bca52824_026964 [Brassica carinata]